MADGNCRYKIAWIMPPLSVASGGVNTILRNSEALVERGCQCDFFFPPCADLSLTEDSAREVIYGWYRYKYPCFVDAFSEKVDESYDAVIATFWDTAQFAAAQKVAKKIYFVQDWEPWFYPVGYEFVRATNSYSLGFHAVTIGRWLALKCRDVCESSHSTDFCADLAVYGSLNAVKEYAICAIYQPEKPRRATGLLLEALRIVKACNPALSVYLFGSGAPGKVEDFISLGVLSTAECNELYNRCLCGVSVSLSNPSRIPFEMMAAGLPVVDVYGEQTSYDLPGEACSLAFPDAASVATAINRLVDDDGVRDDMGHAGARFMRDRPIEQEGERFSRAVFSILGEDEALASPFGVPQASQPIAAGSRENQIMCEMNNRVLKSERQKYLPLLAEKGVSVVLGCREDFDAVRLAFWSEENQGDLSWVDLEKGPDALSWKVVVDFSGNDDRRRVCHWHFYASKGGRREVFLASLDKPVVGTSLLQDGEFLRSYSADLGSGTVSLNSVSSSCDLGEDRTLETSRARRFKRRVRNWRGF